MLQIKKLQIGPGAKPVASNLNFFLKQGERICITGPSGCGKSTLLHCLAGFQLPVTGSIELCNIPYTRQNLELIRCQLTWAPQQLEAQGSVAAFVKAIAGFKSNRANSGLCAPTTIFNEMLLRPDIMSQKMENLSGGEKQRLLLACVLLLDRSLLLLDEPTSALDAESKERVIKLIFKRPGAIISVSHDPDWMKACDRIIHWQELQG